MSNKRTKIIIVVVFTLIIYGGFKISSFQIPITKTEFSFEKKDLYVKKHPNTTLCDPNFGNPDWAIEIVYEDQFYEYYYFIPHTNDNGCRSKYYIWYGMKSYKLSEAIDLGLVDAIEISSNDVIERRDKNVE